MKQFKESIQERYIASANKFAGLRNGQEGKVGYALAWLLGVPIPILVIIYLIRGH